MPSKFSLIFTNLAAVKKKSKFLFVTIRLVEFMILAINVITLKCKLISKRVVRSRRYDFIRCSLFRCLVECFKFCVFEFLSCLSRVASVPTVLILILTTKPAYEIMILFVLRKLILQTRMRSHPVGLDVWFLVRHFIYGWAGSPKQSLVPYVISSIISWAGSIIP